MDRKRKTVRFEVRTGHGEPSEGTKQRGRSRCLFCTTDTAEDLRAATAFAAASAEEDMLVRPSPDFDEGGTVV